MIRIAPWAVDLLDGSKATLRPLTVRERIAVADDYSETEARRAAADAKALGMPFSEALKHISESRRKARVASALIMDCFTHDGAMRVLRAGSDDAERIASMIEPKDLSYLALECLGIDTEAATQGQPGNG